MLGRHGRAERQPHTRGSTRRPPKAHEELAEVLHEVKGETNRQQDLTAPAQRHVSTGGAETCATGPSTHRARHVPGRPPPGPAANAACRRRHRAARRPERSPHRAAEPARRRRAQRDLETARRSAGSAPQATETNASTHPPSVPAPEDPGPARWRTHHHRHAPSVPP